MNIFLAIFNFRFSYLNRKPQAFPHPIRSGTQDSANYYSLTLDRHFSTLFLKKNQHIVPDCHYETSPLDLDSSDLTLKHVKLCDVDPRNHTISHIKVWIYFPLSHTIEINLRISASYVNSNCMFIYIYVNQSMLWLHFSNRLRQFHNLYAKCQLPLLRLSTFLLVLWASRGLPLSPTYWHSGTSCIVFQSAWCNSASACREPILCLTFTSPFPLLSFDTYVLTARCNQMFGGTSVGAGTESLPALWWHLQRYTNLPVKTSVLQQKSIHVSAGTVISLQIWEYSAGKAAHPNPQSSTSQPHRAVHANARAAQPNSTE